MASRHWLPAALVTALMLGVAAEQAVAEPTPSKDEVFITRHPWIFRGGGPIVRYGATKDGDTSGSCLEDRLQFRMDHTVAMRCGDGKDRSGKWRLEATTQTSLVIARPDLGSELRFRTFFHGGDQERLNLQDPTSETLAKKNTWSYGPE